MSSIQILKALILKNAMFYGETMTDSVISMHAEALSDLPLEEVSNAYLKLSRQAKVRRMPLPAEVREVIQPQEDRDRDDLDSARVVAGRIVTAMSRFGIYSTPAAKEFIGELGWEVVKHQGGWETICTVVTTDDLPIFQAQWRDLALALTRRSRMGKREDRPTLPESVMIRLPQITRSIP